MHFYMTKAKVQNFNNSHHTLTYDLQVYKALHGQLQREVGKGVKAGTLVGTHLACHFALELAVEEVDDDGLVA